MNELDGRKINRKALEKIRIRAVKRVESGENPEVVIKALGLTRQRIYEWLAKYREGGIDALRSRKATGKPPKLNGNQLKKIYRLVVGQDPRQLRFEFVLWTRGMVRELIRREFKTTLSEVSVGRLLKKLGLSPQVPSGEQSNETNFTCSNGWLKIILPFENLPKRLRPRFSLEMNRQYDLTTIQEQPGHRGGRHR